MFLKSAEFDESLALLKASSIIKSFADSVWLIKHLHYIIVIYSLRFLNLNSFFTDFHKSSCLHFILKGDLNNLLIVYIVVLFCVVLENSGV
jgi:hypothetical protein